MGFSCGKNKLDFFGYFFMAPRENHFLYLYTPEETGGNSTRRPLIDSIETKDLHLAGPSQLSRALSCLTSSITLSYSRTFAFPSAESINIQLSPANLSGSLITRYKSAYASIYIGIRKQHPVLGTLRSQTQWQGFPSPGSGRIILVLLFWKGWHTISPIPLKIFFQTKKKDLVESVDSWRNRRVHEQFLDVFTPSHSKPVLWLDTVFNVILKILKFHWRCHQSQRMGMGSRRQCYR